jgi:Fic family protein
VAPSPLNAVQAQKAELEARNGRLLFRRALELIPASRGEPDGDGYRLRLNAGIIRSLHKKAMHELCPSAGWYREGQVRVGRHIPPEGRYVSGLVDDMCERAYAESDWDALTTTAYVFWRLNWIHPFRDGNGRTSRAVLMISLCVRLGFFPQGTPTIEEYLIENRQRFVDALRDADEAEKCSVTDVTKMQLMLDDLLKLQLKVPLQLPYSPQQNDAEGLA